MDLKDFALPDVGEGLTEADILRWAVAPGDTVVVNQVLVEVETAKAAVELPSPWAGVVRTLHVSEGETVDVGRAIITIDADPGTPAPEALPAPAAQVAEAQTANAQTPAVGARQPVLVGYGPREGSAGRRARRGPAAPPPALEPVPTANVAFNLPPESPDAGRHRVLAKPPVRKLAKSLGVDLRAVPATGPNGAVSRADVERAAAPAVSSVLAGSGRETRVPIRGVRKHTAAAMVASAFSAPHVTEFLTLDITPTMELRDRIAARREFRDVKLSPLAFVARAVIRAAHRTPEINSTWDEARGEIVQKHYVNLGIAAATERGLIVPNIKDADRLSLLELATAIGDLAATARAGRTTPADLSGGTITISNVGVFGVDTGTPILNPGEAGIVAFGAVRRMPWVVDEQIVPRWVTQLAVSFDHRLVDGQQGSQFLADVAAVLADPALAVL